MPYLTPPDIPLETTCRPLEIPDSTQWLGIVNGALTELIKLHNWEQSDGGLTREQTVARVWVMLNAYFLNDCTGGTLRRLYRIGISGQIQFSDDFSETWEDSEGVDFPVVPPRPEALEVDAVCAAANNAAEVLKLVYLELLEAFAENSDWQYGVGVLLAILGLLIAAIAGAPLLIINALIQFALQAFGYGYVLLGVLSDNDWTTSFHENLICLLRDNASRQPNGVVVFDFGAVSANVSTLGADPALVGWLFYILQVIGGTALNHAGATNHVQNPDCDHCDSQCPHVTFELNSHDFTIINGQLLEGEGEFGGTVLAAVNMSSTVQRLTIEIPMTCNINSWSYRYKYATSRGDTMLSRNVAVYNAQGALLTTSGTGGLVNHFGEDAWRTINLTPYNVGGSAKMRFDLAWSSSNNTGYVYVDDIRIYGT